MKTQVEEDGKNTNDNEGWGGIHEAKTVGMALIGWNLDDVCI
jgi:hypothetical protein